MSRSTGDGRFCNLDDLVYFDRWDFILYRPIAFIFFAAVYRGVIHELGHGIANGLLGGTFGFTSDAGNIIGGYSLHDVLFVSPVLSIRVAEYGTWPTETWGRILMIMAGPWDIILSFWIAVYFINPVRFPCGSEGKWKYYKGAMWGLFFAALADAIYTGPIDAFMGEGLAGDGAALYNLFQEVGWHWTIDLSVVGGGTAVVINPGYILMAIALVGTFAGMLLLFGISPRRRLLAWWDCTFGNVCRI
jgi:hypothetical protein